MVNESLEEVKCWIHEVLAKTRFKIETINFPNYDAFGGFTANMVFVRVSGEKDGEQTSLDLIVKISKTANVKSKTVNFKQMYKTELYVFSEFSRNFRKFAMEKNVTPCTTIPYYYGVLSMENTYVIIMDNLKLKGFKLHELENPFDMNHTKLVLASLAEWAAFNLAFNDQKPDKFRELSKGIVPFSESDVFRLYAATVEKQMSIAIDIYEKMNDHVMADKLENVRNNYRKALRDSSMSKDEQYLVVRHCDCWNNNFLFHYDEDVGKPDKAVVIDWQFASMTSPLTDVAMMLFYCCSKYELQYLDELLEFYHDTLAKKLKELGSDPLKVFPWDVCIKSFRRYAILGIAGVPMSTRMRCLKNISKTMDISDAERDDDFDCVVGGEVRDPDDFFKRIDGIFRICIEKNLM